MKKTIFIFAAILLVGFCSGCKEATAEKVIVVQIESSDVNQDSWRTTKADLNIVDNIDYVQAEYYQFSYNTQLENPDVELRSEEELTVLKAFKDENPDVFEDMRYPIPIRIRNEDGLLNEILYSDSEGNIISYSNGEVIGRI